MHQCQVKHMSTETVFFKCFFVITLSLVRGKILNGAYNDINGFSGNELGYENEKQNMLGNKTLKPSGYDPVLSEESKDTKTIVKTNIITFVLMPRRVKNGERKVVDANESYESSLLDNLKAKDGSQENHLRSDLNSTSVKINDGNLDVTPIDKSYIFGKDNGYRNPKRDDEVDSIIDGNLEDKVTDPVKNQNLPLTSAISDDKKEDYFSNSKVVDHLDLQKDLVGPTSDTQNSSNGTLIRQKRVRRQERKHIL